MKLRPKYRHIKKLLLQEEADNREREIQTSEHVPNPSCTCISDYLFNKAMFKSNQQIT